MKIAAIALMTSLAFAGASLHAASAHEDSIDRLQAATEVLKNIQATSGQGVPDSVLNDPRCTIAIPNSIKGGFIFGAKRSRKGVFAGLTLEGAVVEQHNDSTFVINDREPFFRRVLSGKVISAAPSGGFREEASHIAMVAHDGK